MTDRTHILEGIRRGHDIRVVTPQTLPFPTAKDTMLVLSNIRAFDQQVLLRLEQPYVVFHHDYFCRYRLYYPRSEQCLHRCPMFGFFDNLVKKARLNIFLSPLHYEMHSEVFSGSVEPHVNIPSPVDPAEFHPIEGVEKRDEDISIDTLLPFKGRAKILEYAQSNPMRKINFVGENPYPDEPLPPNCKELGPVNPYDMNRLLNNFTYYVDLPDTPQPFNRSAAEAFLAGLKLVVNDLLGATSWDWFTSRDTVVEHLRAAPKDFWEAVEGAFEK